jgi:hypothetical protein
VFLAEYFEAGPTEQKIPLKMANVRGYAGLELTLL